MSVKSRESFQGVIKRRLKLKTHEIFLLFFFYKNKIKISRDLSPVLFPAGAAAAQG